MGVPSVYGENRSKHLAQVTRIFDNQYLPWHQQLSSEPGFTHRDEEDGAALICVKTYADSDEISV